LAAQMAIAGTLAWGLCRLLGAPRPFFAVLVPLVAMGSDPLGAINVSLGRMLGVFAGVLLGLGLLQLHLASTAMVALLLTAGLAAGFFLRVGTALNTQIAISAVLMLYVGVGSKAEPIGVARIWETAVGAAFAIGVSILLWPPHPVREAAERVSRLRAWVHEDLHRVSGLLTQPDEERAEAELELIRDRSLKAVSDVLELERAERALRFNPRRRGQQATFAEQRGQLGSAARQYRHLRTVARMAADSATMPEAERLALAADVEKLRDGISSLELTDPVGLKDPRAIGIAVKLAEMNSDLSAAS
jgi:uncharacterized membrane protein YgaE (UPF0421/DUF939 family)